MPMAPIQSLRCLKSSRTYMPSSWCSGCLRCREQRKSGTKLSLQAWDACLAALMIALLQTKDTKLEAMHYNSGSHEKMPAGPCSQLSGASKAQGGALASENA